MTAAAPTPTGDEPSEPLLDQWLAKAEGDFVVAGRLADSGEQFHDAVAFHCQQAIEKLLKAALVARGIEPPKVHDLPELFRRVRAAGLNWNWSLTELRTITMGAVHARYPSHSVPADAARDILRITRAIWSSLRPLV